MVHNLHGNHLGDFFISVVTIGVFVFSNLSIRARDALNMCYDRLHDYQPRDTFLAPPI